VVCYKKVVIHGSIPYTPATTYRFMDNLSSRLL